MRKAELAAAEEKRRAMDGMTPEERDAKLKAEQEEKKHQDSQMEHLFRLNKTLVTGKSSVLAPAAGRGRGRGRGKG
jgi:hypothetical protein